MVSFVLALHLAATPIEAGGWAKQHGSEVVGSGIWARQLCVDWDLLLGRASA